MMEPRRLLEDSTRFERALLSSARMDKPADGAIERMLLAVQGLTGGTASSPAAEPAAASGSATPSAPSMAVAAPTLWTKVGLIGLVGLGGLGTGVLAHRMGSSRSVTVEANPVYAPERQVVESAPASSGARPTGSAPVAASATEATPSLPRVRASALRHRSEATDLSLGAETRLLDAARVALDGHDLAAAQRALDGYGRNFPQGRLAPEAGVLRLAVLVQQGDRSSARALASELLSSDSHRTYEHRIRSLLHEGGIDSPRH